MIYSRSDIQTAIISCVFFFLTRLTSIPRTHEWKRSEVMITAYVPPPHTTAQPSLTNVARKPSPSLHVTKPASCDGFVSEMWLLTVCCFMPVALKIFSSFMTVSDAKSCTASQSRLPGLPPMAKCLDPFSTFSPRSGQIKDMTACQGYRVWHISDTSNLRASFPGETILFSNGRPATQLGLCHLSRGISIVILV